MSGRMMSRLLLIVGASLVTFGYSKCVFVSGDGSAVGSSTSSSGGAGFGNDFSTSLILPEMSAQSCAWRRASASPSTSSSRADSPFRTVR